MRIKRTTIQALLIAILFPLWIGCSDNMGTPDNRLVAVSSLIEPIDAREVVLSQTASAAVYFEWDYVDPKEAGVASYRIAFDNSNGDFSNPIHMMVADNNGLANHITIPHKEMDRIAGKAGISPAGTGTIKWTVFSSKGTKAMKSPQEHSLVITRLVETPETLYITGEATEAGADIANAIAIKKLDKGEFEIYTLLTEGKPFQFVTGKTGEYVTYSIALGDNNIHIGETSVVPVTGVYKLYLNFNDEDKTGFYTAKYIANVTLFLNWSQRNIELPYIGGSEWGVTDYEITGLTGNDNNDSRYKFRMISIENLQTMEPIVTEWRANDNDDPPTGNPDYYHMFEKTNVTQWTDNEIWKSPSTDGWSGKKYDITFSLKPDGPYTHNLVIK